MKDVPITRWGFISPERAARQRELDIKAQIQSLIEGAQNEYERQAKTPEMPRIEEQQQLRQAGETAAPLTEERCDSAQECVAEGDSRAKVRIEDVLSLAAAKIGKEIGADAIISLERKQSGKADQPVLVSVFRKSSPDGLAWEKMAYQTNMKQLMPGSIAPIKELLMEGINRRIIRKGERVVCVEDESLGLGYKGQLFIFDVDQVFFNISTMHLTENLDSQSVEHVIKLAMEIAQEGREGRRIGTAFIIGNSEELSGSLRQMIINPFLGYPEEKRRIADPELRETIKNYAQLDGVFVINDKGIIESAGSYINVDAADLHLPGYGTRHRNCCALTKHLQCIAIVVSQSGGKVTIFKDGRIAMRLN
ncbi:hypothetical protein AUJ68_03305 [Candidatus Woesearchaeota archaeon CG1_02_57_44]|nr:MAG: hypothetical protein AUJ68_03305 [Candidatus Woesearchaeota archaeon CG1_02_57_44]